MNDKSVPDRQRDAIAEKIAPYFHPKLKRLSARELPDTFIPDDSIDTEVAVPDADPRKRIRTKIFGRFD
jgi:hypothetical protein